MAKKTLTLLPSLKSLKRGDILMFGANDNPSFAQELIICTQTLFNQGDKYGHSDITHVAIVVDEGKDDGRGGYTGPTIAHVTEDKNIKGYAKEPLWEMLNRDDSERSFLVFRPIAEGFAKSIAKEAVRHPKQKKQIRWSAKAAIQTIIGSNVAQDHQNNIGTNSCCSKFVIQVINKTISRKKQQYAPFYSLNIPPESTPKALESCLYQHNCYEVLCHTAYQDVYLVTKDTIEVALNTNLDKNELEKYKTIFDDIVKELDKTNLDYIQKACSLSQRMLGVFQSPEDSDLRTTTHSTILKNLKKNLISPRDISPPPTTEKNKHKAVQERSEKVAQPLEKTDSNPYERVKAVIWKELKRLQKYVESDKYSLVKDKYDEITKGIKEGNIEKGKYATTNIQKEKFKEEEEIKTIILSREVLARFDMHRSWKFGRTRSSQALLHALKQFGIFEKDLGTAESASSFTSDVISPKIQKF